MSVRSDSACVWVCRFRCPVTSVRRYTHTCPFVLTVRVCGYADSAAQLRVSEQAPVKFHPRMLRKLLLFGVLYVEFIEWSRISYANDLTKRRTARIFEARYENREV